VTYLLWRIDDYESPFQLYVHVPEGFESIEKPPVIVFLHGSGERGDHPAEAVGGIAEVFDELQLPAAVTFPHCDVHHRAFYGEMENRVMKSLDSVIRESNADTSRIYLVGYSMGGSSALYLAARHPDLFAGMVCVAPGITWMGKEPPERLPKAVRELFGEMFVVKNRAAGIAKNVRTTPIWFIQGTEDDPCPIEETRLLVSEPQKLGAEPKVTEYEGTGHDCLARALKEPGLFEWLFAQRRAVLRNS
jgi:predicted peptidase